jgi:hypothetical protein
MKTKFGAIIVEGSGKINGFVAARNRSGSYLRTKVTPVNPQTSAQNVVRDRLAVRSQAWRSLTQAQRDQWNAAVPSFTRTDIFGDVKTPSGFNLFCQLNNIIVLSGGTAVSVPPLPAAVPFTTLTSVSADVSDDEVLLNFVSTTGAVTMLIYATPGVSPGKAFVKSEYRFIGASDVSGAETQEDISAKYKAVFGAVPTAGQKIFVKVVFASKTTGITTSLQTVDTLVVA